ncbi:MAG: DnaD domain protein [Bacilli bacterium]|nr:DnaD domain protein [Bacilli bacterium]
MDKKLIELYKSGNMTIPLYILKNRDKLKIELDEFIFLMYLYNKGNDIIFNPGEIGNELGISLEKVMEYISRLSDKKYVKVKSIKNDKDIIEDRINIDYFYQKLSLIMVGDAVEQNNSSSSSVFSFIEKEFGRTLSPMEVEIIKSWLQNSYTEELVKEAVKEAVFNGVNNLRYIDKILFEWQKKGIKDKAGVEKNREAFRKKNREESSEVEEEIFDYNWFEDDEDE